MHRRVNSSPRHPGATSPAGARACGDRRTIGGLPALAQDPRVGLIRATAFAGSIGDIRSFRSPRRFAAWLGLTPREFSSGNIRRLGSISKRGDGYLRMLLVHGARAVLYSANAAQRAGRPQARPDHLGELVPAAGLRVPSAVTRDTLRSEPATRCVKVDRVHGKAGQTGAVSSRYPARLIRSPAV